MTNGGRDGWPTLNGDDDRMTDARTHFGAWVELLARQSYEFRVPFDNLVEDGCDWLRLAWLLSALLGRQQWAGTSTQGLRECAEDLENAAVAVRTLFFSQAGRVLGLDSMRLEEELRELARRVLELEPDAHQGRPIARDLARAALVNYVRRTTGQFHDDEVAAVISVVESLNEEEAAMNYTRDAHVRWRNRPSCQAFLDGPSPAVRELEKAMEDDLRGR